MKPIQVATHSGNFHPDDVFSVATLELYLKQSVAVVRTRDQEKIKGADFVVDVGLELDPTRKRFDHHQAYGAGTRSNGVPYASFGLVWKEYGEKICGSREIAEKIDQRLIQYVDSTDNGIETVKSINPATFYSIYDYFTLLNPTWEEKSAGVSVDEKFIEAVAMAKQILEREIVVARNYLLGQEKIKRAYETVGDKRLIILDGSYEGKESLSNFAEPLYVISPQTDSDGWKLTTVHIEPKSFINRKDLPSAWAAKAGAELEKITGVSGALFCHRALFIATAKTKEAILNLAELALRE